MSQLNNQIALYSKLTERLAEEVGIHFATPVFSYSNQGETIYIEVEENFDNILTINEFDSEWSPIEDNLEIQQKCVFNNPSKLYGIHGLTLEENLIGLAVHIHSKKSNFQKTIPISAIPNTSVPFTIDFSENFMPSSLRGDVNLDFFIYLAELSEINPSQASTVGTVLNNEFLNAITIVTDGDGSVFPMSEFEDKKGPLWKIEKYWIEPNIDTFDISNVNLMLNISHPLFDTIKNGKQRVSSLMMTDIMVQAMTAIIQEVIIGQGYSVESDDVLPNSILAVVQYWVSTYEIDVTSLLSIANTMREYWHVEPDTEVE
ncbi:hypothetical protein [Aerococcus urinaeequi]|uniref:Uncharacterized protein n=1 Tax=Aerococcus urinaeequi TaxID=51665 RepID=A0AAC8X0H4_9LACT|nr:hypothetical protein [Aerococcus urinaeequi]AMB97392.1 hypothetical protein AWM74_03650 [Aerococcus urinaeequi]